MFSKSLIFGDNLPTWALLLELALGGLLVTGIGWRLTHVADAIGDRLNLGKAWIGLILLASITSLPEVVTGITAVQLGEPDLAFGNIFGSCMFNVAIIVLLNSFMPGGSILRGAKLTHSLSSTLGVVMMGLGVLSCWIVYDVATGGEPGAAPPASAGLIELICCTVIGLSYLGCIRMNYRFERRVLGDEPAVTSQPSGARGSYALFGFLAVLLIATTIWLTRTADVLESHPLAILGGRSLGATFVGAFFLSICTSLPEIATSIAAVRMGHLDLALGNIFGSNMFNIFVIPMLKVASLIRGDRVLMAGENFSLRAHTITGLFAILITSIAVASLLYRSQRRVWYFGFDSFLIGLTYIIGMVLLLKP